MLESDLLLESADHLHYFPPLSVRECQQTLSPLPCGEMRRTVDGRLVHVGGGPLKKFHSLVTGRDVMSPAFEKLWRGSVVRVGCLPFLTQPVLAAQAQVELEREPVLHYVCTRRGERLRSERSEGRTVFLGTDFPGGFITYRPWLVMMVKGYHFECDEWEGTVEWRLELEEQ